MKKLLLTSLLFGSLASYACIDINNVEVCVGDNIASSRDGNIFSITKIVDGKITARRYTHPSLGYVYLEQEAEETYVAQGCINNLCVGTNVIPDDNSNVYQVIGVNYATGEFLIENYVHASTGARVQTNSQSELSLTEGCLDNVCVGDNVIPNQDNNTFKVKAVNLLTGDIFIERFIHASIGHQSMRKKANELTVQK